MDNNLSVRFLVDVPPATSYVAHSSELKKALVNKLRSDFLNFNGQDYFARGCSPAQEQALISNWQNQAEAKYSVVGDYEVNIATGEATIINMTTATPVRICKEYSWSRTGVNSGLLVSIIYTDCNCNVQKIEAISSTLASPLLVCSYDIPTVTAGVVAYTQLCPSGNS
jgi:hypothetical protein